MAEVTEFKVGHLYKANFSQPIKFPTLSPKNIKIPFGGRFLVWGVSGSDSYGLFIFVLSSESSGSANSLRSLKIGTNVSQMFPITAIIIGILAVLGLGLTIILFKNVEEVLGAGGLGITIAAGIGIAGIFLVKKIT